MAKLLFGVGVADARNKLGGHVFSKNRFGAYVRQKVSPTQPRTAAQLAIRSVFGTLSKQWGQILSDLERQAWISLAATNPRPDQFGNPQVLTGLQLFQSVNRNLSTIGKAAETTAPPGLHVDGLTEVSVTSAVTGSHFDVDWKPQSLGAHMHIVITATPPMSPGKSFFTPFLKILFADPNDASAGPLDLFATYHDLFGQLQENQKIGVSAYVINDQTGGSSVPATASGITAV